MHLRSTDTHGGEWRRLSRANKTSSTKQKYKNTKCKNTKIQKYKNTKIHTDTEKKQRNTSLILLIWIMSQHGRLLINRLEPSKGEEWQESDLWAGPQTAIHTHSKPPCDCVSHMPSRSPHITVCTTMIHSQPTCDCAWQCGKLWLALFLTFNIYPQSPSGRPSKTT